MFMFLKRKIKKNKMNLILENKEKFSFFPFNEGESVERKRAEQKIVLNQEMRERSRQIAQMPAVLSGSKTRENSINNRDVNSEQLSPVAQTANMFYSPLGSPGDASHQFSADKNQIPESFKNVYPKFMEPHKHYPYRRLNDTHVEKVMQDAIKKIEVDVRNNEERRVKQSKEFQDRFDIMIRQAESSNLMKQKDELSLKEFHKIQMEEKAKFNQFYNSEDKKPQNIYYGPKEKDFKEMFKAYFGNAKGKDVSTNSSEADKNNANNLTAPSSNRMNGEITKNDIQKFRRHELKKQIDDKRRLENARKLQERVQDVENLWVAGQFMAKERGEINEKDRLSKSMYNKIWKEQMSIRNKMAKIKNEGFEKIG